MKSIKVSVVRLQKAGLTFVISFFLISPAVAAQVSLSKGERVYHDVYGAGTVLESPDLLGAVSDMQNPQILSVASSSDVSSDGAHRECKTLAGPNRRHRNDWLMPGKAERN